ncbi:maleylpyruvate isomerase N-terminal domain-containing protein [Amycolatopsis sp. CA-230715]|uniref:maleylpyruvate isomerase N-terminal domain-containing protein n=1 Tax=Amycolatopsis sp. CA-230715 TaxID=2745196 RepID=UPI001C02EDA4|nr:maleylpyruvate isomerase N-terminal domain-containing protein [Amycolatopsis sp. CA-230715]QWF77657.1 hypothetical protein HUW46_01049 [Amycolatopsis sp. CA-230715]
MRGHALVGYGRFLQVLEIEGELLAEAANSASPDAPVPGCPGFTVATTVRHVGSVSRMVLEWLRGRGRPRTWQRDPVPGQTEVGFLRSALAELRAELAAHRPDERAATWWPADPTYGFWRRRMAHETTVHRVDVQTAATAPRRSLPGITEDIAVDGIDEVLTLWFGQRLPMLGLSADVDTSVAVRSGGHTWLVSAGPGETVAWRCSAREAENADAVLSAPPVQMYLWLWGRRSLGEVTPDGDAEATARFWALLRLATR